MLTATLTGYVGSVKFVHAPGKSQVLNINIASNRRVGEREFTDWISLKLWGERAEKLAPHISKGMHLLVTGRPEARGFRKADGTVAGELVLHIAELEFLSAKFKGEAGEDHADSSTHAPYGTELRLEMTGATAAD